MLSVQDGAVVALRVAAPAQRYCSVANAMELTYPSVPLLCYVQLVPPSSVCRMMPAPTAQPDCGVTKTTEWKPLLILTSGDLQTSKCHPLLGMQDRAFASPVAAHYPARLRSGKRNRIEVFSNEEFVHVDVLRLPSVATVCGVEDGAVLAQRPALLRRGESYGLEAMLGAAVLLGPACPPVLGVQDGAVRAYSPTG